ncbi:unnamed protein product [Allacma fusca]|uniref:Uncharacterized protein n=1 Tax=Allacma fusca TaxID=39272 RepID=A0A8J2NZS5_9HEXA|nr:unnamed protein product [Allacma fusca]
MESDLNSDPPTVFHQINDPNELPAPISEGIGKVLQRCSKNACFLQTIPLELVPGTNKIRACRSKFAMAKFWLSWVIILAEAVHALFKFVYVTHYDVPVTRFGYLYTGLMTGLYWVGVILVLLTFLRRYELQEFINTISYCNQHAGSEKKSGKGISIMYLLMRYLPFGMYLLGGGNAVVFLACKNAPITIYSSLDSSYRDGWFVLIPHMLHDVMVPCHIITTILFALLWILGYLELVKLQCLEYL